MNASDYTIALLVLSTNVTIQMVMTRWRQEQHPHAIQLINGGT